MDYIIDETVNGKKTGTFKLFDGDIMVTLFSQEIGVMERGNLMFNLIIQTTKYCLLLMLTTHL